MNINYITDLHDQSNAQDTVTKNHVDVTIELTANMVTGTQGPRMASKYPNNICHSTSNDI
jgi:hypothetical protein